MNLYQYGPRSFRSAGPTVWNSLPCELRDENITLPMFGRKLKTFLFSQTFSFCQLDLVNSRFINAYLHLYLLISKILPRILGSCQDFCKILGKNIYFLLRIYLDQTPAKILLTFFLARSWQESWQDLVKKICWQDLAKILQRIYLGKILPRVLPRSWQDLAKKKSCQILGKNLGKNLSRSCQALAKNWNWKNLSKTWWGLAKILPRSC